TLQEKVQSSVAEIISDHLLDSQVQMKRCVTNEALANELKHRKYLLAIEDVDACSVRHLQRRQRVDECLYYLCQQTNIRIVTTMGTTLDELQTPMLLRIPRSTMRLRAMADEDIRELFWSLMKKTHFFHIAKKIEAEKIEKLIRECKGVPEAINYVILAFTQGEMLDEPNNLYRFVANQVLEHKHAHLLHPRYYVPICVGEIQLGQIREKIRDKEARDFWVDRFQRNSFGDWPTIAKFIKKRYKEKVGNKNAKIRPLNIDSSNTFEYEFITQELFQHFADEAGVELLSTFLFFPPFPLKKSPNQKYIYLYVYVLL
ncbi:hypothetical protein RFI_15200, partial [Reticulomyxa filosa]